MYIVYIHTKRLPYYLDFIPDENLFGFDGYDCSPEAGKRFCDSYNRLLQNQGRLCLQNYYSIKLIPPTGPGNRPLDEMRTGSV